MRYVDLFCGAGTVSKTLADMDLEHVVSVDAWKTAVDSCVFNSEGNVLKADLSQDPAGILRRVGISSNFDGLIWMSPPCQGYSTEHSDRFVDGRNWMLPHCVSEVCKSFPKCWVVLENVAGFLQGTRTSERTYLAKSILVSRGVALHDDTIKGYVLDATAVGVPQSRRRLLLPIPPRGSRLPKSYWEAGLLPQTGFTIRDAIRDLVADAIDAASPAMTKRETEVFNGMPPGGNWRSTPASRRYARKEFGSRTPPESYLRRSSWDDLPACVLATARIRLKSGAFMHPSLPRRYNLAELRTFQAIPKDFWFSGNVKERLAQIGNAVPPPMARAAVQNILSEI